MHQQPTFLDLFAGGGGLSEGFVQAGFVPVAHVEKGRAQCFTLRTRTTYHWMKKHDDLATYIRYLNGEVSRTDFYMAVPEHVGDSIINEEISDATIAGIFQRIDKLLDGAHLDIIVGGPPCQAYSIAGRSRDRAGMIGDNRNYLYRQYARFLEKYQPKYFVFENVKGLLSARDRDGTLHLDAMRTLFKGFGYETEHRTLTASDYGVLQNRKRVFLVGRRGKRTGFYPQPDRVPGDFNVNEVFCDLPPLSAGAGSARPCELNPYDGTWQYKAGIRDENVPVTLHQARPHSLQDLDIYHRAVELWNSQKYRLTYDDLPDSLKTHRNRKSFVDRFKVVAGDLPSSQTVVAHIAKDGHYYIHPDIEQNRSITPREAARLQTFPDNYYFESVSGVPARTPAFSQIGDAVPVLLARKVAEKIREELV